MKNLVFMLWVLLWPLCSAITNYISAKENKIRNHSQGTEKDSFKGMLTDLAIWVIVAYFLFEL